MFGTFRVQEGYSTKSRLQPYPERQCLLMGSEIIASLKVKFLMVGDGFQKVLLSGLRV